MFTVKNVVRDENSKAVVSKDNTSLEEYKKLKKKNREMSELKERVDALETLVKELIEKTNG